jgi:hypothetical protein
MVSTITPLLFRRYRCVGKHHTGRIESGRKIECEAAHMSVPDKPTHRLHQTMRPIAERCRNDLVRLPCSQVDFRREHERMEATDPVGLDCR